MSGYRISWLLIFAFTFALKAYAQPRPQPDSLHPDSLNKAAEVLLLQQQQQQQIDSLIKQQLQKELQQAAGDKRKTIELEEKLKQIAINDSVRKASQEQRIDSLKKITSGFAIAPFSDTLFYIYTKTGSFSAAERAAAVNQRIRKLYDDSFYKGDSLKVIETESGFDIVYNNDKQVLSVTNLDALWLNRDGKEIANEYLFKIKNAIANELEENSLVNWLKRIGMVLLVISGLGLLIFLINRLFRRLKLFLAKHKEKYFHGLTIRKTRILRPADQQRLAFRLNNILRILVIVLSVYLSLPLLFSIFPETKTWTDTLLKWILTPARSALKGIVDFLPNLFTILVIYFIFRITIKGLKYFVDEIERGNIHLAEFHPDWAQPTFNIIKFLLYAFMLVLIFPYLPGSRSAAFQGISVFLGVLLSFGSSSAISNTIAGLVITYMRPFKIGDRIKIGDVTGDVIEKTMLVTRIRTIKNEDITIPNSNVLSSSTVNYSSNTKPEDSGLILHSTVTIGYDVPWKKMHEALINAALRTEMIMQEPRPFVLQTSLDDFYVSYQVNAYTKEPNKQAIIYSQLHQNIQDCCNEAGIEILSPHYRAARDGNSTTIPADYLGKDYKPPSFNIKMEKDDQ